MDRDVMRRFFQSASHRLKKTCLSPRTHVLSVGATAGAMLLAWCFQWTARLGTSLAVVSALSLAILVGIEQSFRPLKRPYTSKTLLCTILAALAVLATWTVSLPWLLDWQTQLLGAFSPLQLSQPWLNLAVCFGFALVLITPPVIVVARLPFCLLEASRNAPFRREPSYRFSCWEWRGVY